MGSDLPKVTQLRENDHESNPNSPVPSSTPQNVRAQKIPKTSSSNLHILTRRKQDSERSDLAKITQQIKMRTKDLTLRKVYIKTPAPWR